MVFKAFKNRKQSGFEIVKNARCQTVGESDRGTKIYFSSSQTVASNLQVKFPIKSLAIKERYQMNVFSSILKTFTTSILKTQVMLEIANLLQCYLGSQKGDLFTNCIIFAPNRIILPASERGTLNWISRLFLK